MNVRLDKQLLLTVVVIGMMISFVVVPYAVKSRRTFYSFEIIMPEEVEALPGETVTIEGEILVTGFYWLHDFELTVDGLSYEYDMEPQWWEHVRILRDWNPDQGVFRVPEKFTLDLNVPEDATGSYIVTITGQEHRSFRQTSNFTFFVLRVGGEPIEPQLSISDILVPEEITEYEPFKITFKVNNEGPIDTEATITINVPEDWQVDGPTQTLNIPTQDSAASSFDIIPTTTVGEVSLFVEYPFRQEVINFTKAGPYLIPTGALVVPEEEAEPILTQIYNYLISILDKATMAIENVAGPYATSLIMGVVFVLFIIILWLIFDIVKFLKKGSSPETTKTSDSNSNDLGVRITEV